MMFKSIRWTLQIWHAGILFLALASFGAVLFSSAYRTTYTEVDNELAAAARALAGYSPASWRNLPTDSLAQLGWDKRDQPYFVFWAANGSVIRQSSLNPSAPRAFSGRGADALEFHQRGDLREVVAAGPNGSTILIGRSIHREQASLADLRWSIIGAGSAILLIGLLGGRILHGRALRPIYTISDAARSISASDLSCRIPASQVKSELGSLAETLNDMFDRLETAFHLQAQFTADASHELRTPLAVIRAGSELALTRQRTAEEYRRTIESNFRASCRMNSLVDSLLVLARADADVLTLQRQRIDLRQEIDECVDLLAPLARQRNVSLYAEGDAVHVEADRDRILQLTTNLLSNAIQYNRDGGSVKVTLSRDGHDALLKVIDTGIGIARHDQPRIFNRFFRVDKARSRDSGGSGLGLAICKCIVTAHGGSISFGSEPGAGTTFTVRLPIATELSESAEHVNDTYRELQTL
jgi:heavy metal sensor kinase